MPEPKPAKGLATHQQGAELNPENHCPHK